MRFIYDGDYREFRGYVFAWRKPVTVQDKATIEACLRDPSFKEVPNAVQVEKTPQAASTAILNPNACRKCGKVFKQGRYMHEKHCLGLK